MTEPKIILQNYIKDKIDSYKIQLDEIACDDEKLDLGVGYIMLLISIKLSLETSCSDLDKVSSIDDIIKKEIKSIPKYGITDEILNFIIKDMENWEGDLNELFLKSKKQSNSHQYVD